MRLSPLAVLLIIAGCASAPTAPADPEAAYVEANAREIALESEGFEDLAFLRPLLADKRVVQLGENTHGVREYSQAKARIVQFLHQELGFTVLALESPVYQCDAANRDAGEASARLTLANCAYGVWQTEEMMPLFEYLRTTQSRGRLPLRLAGFDTQPIGRNKAGRSRFLADLATEAGAVAAADAFALDSLFLDVYGRGSRRRRAYFRTDDGTALAARYDRLAATLGPDGPVARALPGDDRVVVARQTARSMAAYVRQQAAPSMQAYVEHRDGGMADNLAALLDEQYPDERVVVWGHNFHLRHDNLAIPPDTSSFPGVAARTAGSWVRERYGDAVYTVGVYAYQGQSANNGGEAFDIPPAPPGSVEARLYRSSAEALFLDLSQAPRGAATAWIDEPTVARFDGAVTLSLVPRDQYDALLVVGIASPRRPLD